MADLQMERRSGAEVEQMQLDCVVVDLVDLVVDDVSLEEEEEGGIVENQQLVHHQHYQNQYRDHHCCCCCCCG